MMKRSLNRLLRALPAGEYEAVAGDLEPIDIEARTVLYDVDRPIKNVYFPETCVVSLVGVMADGTAVETATVGLEGVVGLPIFLGTDRTSGQAFVQVSGRALRMSVDAFRKAIRTSPAWTEILHRYTQALFTLVAQNSACNRVHMMTERCARWLLHSHDRLKRDEFPLSHQFLSQMLGVRRATVTEAMQRLQGSGVTYGNGRVRITDRKALEAAACECYAVVAREFNRLLGEPETVPSNPLEKTHTSDHGLSTLKYGAPANEENPRDTDR